MTDEKLKLLEAGMAVNTANYDNACAIAKLDYARAMREARILHEYQRLRFIRAAEGRPLRAFVK